MSQIHSWILLSCCLAACGRSAALAQEQEASSDNAVPEDMVVKVYRVDDLVLPTHDYPFRGTMLPAMPTPPRSAPRQGGVMGGMGGGMGGVGGGGMGMIGQTSGEEADADATIGTGSQLSQSPAILAQMGGAVSPAEISGAFGIGGRLPGAGTAITLEDLIRAITAHVEPTTWEDVGGEGSISRLGGALIVNQTEHAHKRINGFLRDLRESGGIATRTVTVEARWLLLDSDQLDQLLGDEEGAKRRSRLDPKRLRSLAKTQRFRGQVTCFNGQTVHIVSGRLHTLLQGAIPVVATGGPGYQPLTISPHVGALLQVTPSVVPNGDSALLDVQSTVTHWDPLGEPVELFAPGTQQERGVVGDSGLSAASAGGIAVAGRGQGALPVSQVDRMNVAAQQLATTLRVPLGRPVLVGGLTYPGADDAARQEDAQLYLVVEVRVNDD